MATKLITDWRKLKVGMHIRLSCGCAGFVRRLHLEPSKNDCDTGFYLVYTCGLSCPGSDPQKQAEGYESMRRAYRHGYGPYPNMFNYDLHDSAMPAEVVPIPEWWWDIMLARSGKDKYVWDILLDLGHLEHDGEV